MQKLREGWNNAFYRGTMCYVAMLVTIIFGLQIYRYFFNLPAESIYHCGMGDARSYSSLIPVIGAFFDEKP